MVSNVIEMWMQRKWKEKQEICMEKHSRGMPINKMKKKQASHPPQREKSAHNPQLKKNTNYS